VRYLSIVRLYSRQEDQRGSNAMYFEHFLYLAVISCVLGLLLLSKVSGGFEENI